MGLSILHPASFVCTYKMFNTNFCIESNFTEQTGGKEKLRVLCRFAVCVYFVTLLHSLPDLLHDQTIDNTLHSEDNSL